MTATVQYARNSEKDDEELDLPAFRSAIHPVASPVIGSFIQPVSQSVSQGSLSQSLVAQSATGGSALPQGSAAKHRDCSLWVGGIGRCGWSELHRISHSDADHPHVSPFGY